MPSASSSPKYSATPPANRYRWVRNEAHPGRCPTPSVVFIGMETVSIELRTRDELAGLDVPTLEAILRDTDRFNSRMAGFSAAVRSALGKARSGQPNPSGGGDRKSRPAPPSPDNGAGPAPAPTPAPSTKAELKAIARSRRLDAHPDVADALEQGLINVEQADAIINAKVSKERTAELLAGAVDQNADETFEAVKAAERAEDGENNENRYRRQKANRSMLCGNNDAGMVWFNGELDPVTGQPIKDIFDAECRKQFQADRLLSDPTKHRTARQIGADVFAAMMLGTLTDTTETNTADVSSTKPRFRINLTMDLADIGDDSAVAFTAAGAPVPVSMVRNNLCKAEILLWASSPDGKHYRLFTADRYANEHQKQCLALRDGGCVWRGCNMQASKCDAHHLKFRAEGGDTALENMALLCPTHHRKLHNMGALLWMGDTASDWHLVQDHSNRLIDQWSNPPPRQKPALPPNAARGAPNPSEALSQTGLPGI
jgi:hypothetical protein